MIAPTFMRGFSDAYGSWKIICARLRKRLSAAPLSVLDLLAVEAHRAVGGPVQAEHGAAGGGLAGARLADQGQRLAARDLEADAVDGMQHV